MKTATILSSRQTLSICFALIGIGHIAALWFDLYRLVTLSLLAAVVIAHGSGSVRPGRAFGIANGLLQASPIYLYALISTLWSPDPATALRDAAYMSIAVAPSIALGITLARRYSGLQIAQGLGVLLLPFAFQAVASAFERGDPMLVGNGTMRSLLGSVICLISPILAGAWALTRQRRFLVYGLITAAFAVTMESRSVILFATPAALVSLYLHDPRLAHRILKRWTLPFAIVVVLASPIMLARLASDSTSLDVSESVIEELQLPSEDRVDVDRRLTTFTATVTFLEYPIFGRGYSGIFQTHQMEYGLELSAHGLIPGTLSELGLVGMAILVWILWRVFRRTTQALRNPESCDPMLTHFRVGFCAILLLGLFHQTIESVFFGLILGLLMGFCPFARSRKATTHHVGVHSSKRIDRAAITRTSN